MKRKPLDAELIALECPPAKVDHVDQMGPIEFRMRHERIYTLIKAQEVAENKVILTKKMQRDLDRYARWHFNRSFGSLVRECQEMMPEEE